MKQRNKLRVAELFGPTLQGEGPTTGRPAYFLRLTGCNLMCGGWGTQKDGQLHGCATWRCDSIEVWLKGQLFTYEQIYEQLAALGFTHCDRLVITGGEPLMQQADIVGFIQYLRVAKELRHLKYEVETNGTIVPELQLKYLIHQFNVSPKLANSGMTVQERINPDAIIEFNTRAYDSAVFKFVVSSKADLEQAISEYIRPFELSASKVWIMPAADNRKALHALLPEVAEWCKEYKYNLSNRLHIEIWNQKVGV